VSELRTVSGFEDAWRPVVRPRRNTPEAVLRADESGSGGEVRARLARLVARTPEVMVKITGRTRDAGHLRAHLEYISRTGELETEDRDGNLLVGRDDVRELAEDWSAAALSDSRRRARTPFSVSIVLSMPAQTDPSALRDAAQAFAGETFGARFDYVFVLHTDAGHPHVHLSIRALGEDGGRLNPKKADLEAWRQAFARALRDRGVAAEATPRRARGVTLKSERTALRKIRERQEAGQGAPARVKREAYREAARAAFAGEVQPTVWEVQTVRRQARIRGLYLTRAKLLMASVEGEDRVLGREVMAWVGGMPPPDSQRLVLARQLRAANERLQADGPARAPDPPGRGRGR
jgi:type IV secretory pathway VirD2 relaxase